jgi:predicted alpha/beta hydrolase family esterase
MGCAQYGSGDGTPIVNAHGGFAPVVWAGTRDELVNPSWPHRLASRILNATLNIRHGGHFMAHLHYREIFEVLKRQ